MDVVLHESRFLTISAVVQELLSLGRSPRMAKWLAEWERVAVPMAASLVCAPVFYPLYPLSLVGPDVAGHCTGSFFRMSSATR